MFFSLNSLNKVWMEQENPVFRTNSGTLGWPEFSNSALCLASKLEEYSEENVGLYFESPLQFSVAFLGAVTAGKNIHCFSVLPIEDLPFPLLTDSSGRSAISVETVPETTVKIPADEPGTGGDVFFYTSGSTGSAKNIRKELKYIDRELKELVDLWGGQFRGNPVHTTVSHQHFYGFLFSILLPLASGGTLFDRRLAFPESLNSLDRGVVNLIASPAFLKRVEGVMPGKGKTEIQAYSSGGFLPPEVAGQCSRLFGKPVLEIYGSTETGGIAWKSHPGSGFWNPFSCILVGMDADEGAYIESEYLSEARYFLDDEIEIQVDNSFKLLGRKDAVVKVEDKRVSLLDMESALAESGLISDSLVCLIEGRRQYTAALIVLNKQGLARFQGFSGKEINRHFRDLLEGQFHSTVLPKKWRYLNSLPRNAQGKIKRSEMISYFDNSRDKKDYINLPEIISTSVDSRALETVLVFHGEYRYFDGHFPELKILPALAQLDWAMKAAAEHFGKVGTPVRIPRIKFKSPIFPGVHVKLKITLSEDLSQIQFEYRSVETGGLHSGGKVYLEV